MPSVQNLSEFVPMWVVQLWLDAGAPKALFFRTPNCQEKLTFSAQFMGKFRAQLGDGWSDLHFLQGLCKVVTDIRSSAMQTVDNIKQLSPDLLHNMASTVPSAWIPPEDVAALAARLLAIINRQEDLAAIVERQLRFLGL